MLLCERIDGEKPEKIVAVDLTGAGIGSEVLVSRRYGAVGQDSLIDDWIVGIVDSIS